jgi:hypothetical protein
MDKIWLKHYPPGVPAEIDADAYPSVNAMFDASVLARLPSRRSFLRGVGAAAITSALAGCYTREPDEPGRVTLNFFMYATPEWLKLYNDLLIPAFAKPDPW